MTQTRSKARPARTKPRWRKWISRGFIVWAVVSTSFVASSFRTRGVDPVLLASSANVTPIDGEEALWFLPKSPNKAGLIFVCGSGVAAEAYAPLLRPIADAGYPVIVVRLPYRFAPLESHKLGAIGRIRGVMEQHPEVTRWVLSGHSLGGAIACRIARDDPRSLAALVLVGTTHPKSDSLATLRIPVTKVFGSNDGIAPREKIDANKGMLPKHTKWVMIEGANHSQFGNYGHQFLDGSATISRREQQDRTRQELLSSLAAVDD